MMNELEVKENDKIKIENLIYEIRGKQVMLDSDLALLYKCTNGTKDINKAVNRNISRFPEDFYFQLTNEEYTSLRFQIGTLKGTRGQHKKYLPYVFTEQGIAMLASVLRTSIASQMSVDIMRAFITMRYYISNNLLEQKYINNQVIENTENIKLLQKSFKKFEEKQKVNEIFFNGQIYDAYSLLLDIFDSSKDTIIVIDNYVDKKLFDLLSKTDKKIKVYTSNIDNELINKYQKQYNNVTIIKNDNFHDRFIIIDNKTLYHSGASFKDLGKKCFAINKIEDENILQNLLEVINNE